MNPKSVYYKDKKQFLVAVDCIIFGFKNNELCLLLVKRGFNPGKGQWSLAGGFLDDNESIDQAARRVLHQLTGLEDLFMEQVNTFGEPGRDPGQRVLSVCYYALINIEDYKADWAKTYHTKWVNINQLPPLVFDHTQMVQKALESLQQKASTKPIGFNLMPEKFSLNQLQNLYQAIFQKILDNRNFRKKVKAFDFIEALDEKDKSYSKKGAFLYRFNKERYDNSSFKFI